MKKLLLLLCALLAVGVSGVKAESKISKAVAGTYLFDSSNPALTVNKGRTATITSNDGVIVIHHDDLSEVTGSRTYAAVVMRVDMPTTAPESFSNFINLKASSNYDGSIGLGVTTEGKLKGTWEAGKNGGTGEWSPSGGGVETASAVTGEHTIVMLCNNDGTTIYVDNSSTSANKSGLKCATRWTDLRIESGYVSCVKSIYVFSGEQKDNIATFFSEMSNVVTVANEETKSVSDNSTATRFFVASGGTLTADAAYDLDKVEGAGDVTLTADQSISGSVSTVATGKLTINEGKTLTLGTGDSQTNSIESFTSIELAGTIKHDNSAATLNNVTVPADETGKIFAYDMGTAADGFTLAGTTTLNGNLTVCNKWNFQMKVDNLAGSGTWLICGTDDDAFNAEETASKEKSIINVAAATTFTGTINLNNVPSDNHPGTNTSQVTVQGNLVGCTLKKTSGDYFYYSGSNLNGTTLDGIILSGTSVITTSNTVNIKDLAGNNLTNDSKNYAFVGSGTINFYGICDLTKKTDGTTCNYANIGYGSGNSVVFKEGSTVTVGIVLNSSTVSSNASVTVESGATLTTNGSEHVDNNSNLIYSPSLTNNGTINLNAANRTSIVNALSGSGTFNFASGAKINTPSVPNTMTLTGAGDVVLTTFPSSTAPTLTEWTGAVQFPDGGSYGTNMQDIFNAWGNTNSTIKLNNVSGGYLGSGGTVNPTLNILSGKTLTLSNGYSGSNATLTKVTGAGTLDRQGWSGSNNHNLYITTLTDFSGTLKGTGHPIIVKKLVLSSAPNADALLIKTSGTVTLNTEDPDGLYVGLQRTSAYTWETKTVEDVEGIYVSALNQVQRNREIATAVVTPYYTYIGTGVGKYTISLGANNYTSIADFTEAINAWTTTEEYAEPSVTINQPTSAFYRIKSSDNYLQDIRKSDSETQRTLTNATGADEATETIFYLNSNTLLGYKTGYGFGYSVCMTKDTEHLNTQLFTESAEKGKYTIQSQQGTCASADYNEGYWGASGSDLSREDDEANGACWTIEEVTSLPVTISSAGYATLWSPVALTIPTGVTAYTATDKGTYLTLTVIEGTTIPKETGVILKGTEGSYSFSITDDVDEISSSLTGSAATIAKPTGAYYLGNGARGIGFYPGDESAITTFAGFKAYLPASVGVKEFLGFDFGDATAIRSIDNAQLTIDNAEIYNLAGQRLDNSQFTIHNSQMKRGVYIVNGKKVLVK